MIAEDVDEADEEVDDEDKDAEGYTEI